MLGPMTKRRKITLTLVAIVTAALAWSGVADGLSDDYADEAFKRALVTFAVARTLNGVISVAQGTEVAVEPGGVGVNFTVGQILDPINDLVEHFSSVMLVATSSLGLQNILLNMTSWWGVSAVLLALGAVLVAVCCGADALTPPPEPVWCAACGVGAVSECAPALVCICAARGRYNSCVLCR